ncbi:hypothetical protein F5Y06DRAFT_287403 [Hypoxylon sp. FL0890]|nr:hypothetical protein F5Y06DRAFT_287403 [Hypoxylon sp. FL0890]
MFGDNLYDYSLTSGPSEAYKDKDHRRGRSTSRLSTSESSSTPFSASASPGSAWLAGFPRLPKRLGRYLPTLLGAIIFLAFWKHFGNFYGDQERHANASKCASPLGSLPESRVGEVIDTLAEYKYRSDGCNISSLDLHMPFGSVCPEKSSMLTAMSSGGRIGRDAPYLPRGCDMQWFNTVEVCEVLGRYSQVIIVGDSMLRHVIGALNILIRENLGYGGVTDWNFSEDEKRKCFCNNQFDVRDCSIQGIFSTADVVEHDPLSLMCPKMIPEWNTDLRIEQIVRYPIPEDERQRFEKAIDSNPSQRKAFILGHGLWSNLEVGQTLNWLDTVLNIIESKTGSRMRLRGRSPRRNLPVLLMTPNAAGDKKPDEWIVSQGNKALVQFEHAMAVEAAKRRIDHLGTWNMSIQATMYDGVHMDMRGNLLKAMMVLNWLNLLEV